MANGLWSGLGKLFSAGTAYVQHVNFARQALQLAPGEAMQRLSHYVSGLSDASFAGLKVTLGMLISQEPNAAVRASLQQLFHAADAARQGQAPESLPVSQAAAALTPGAGLASFDQDLARVGGWFDTLDADATYRALTNHVAQLSEAGYRQFAQHVQQMAANCAARIQQHEAMEDTAWGGSFEDRMAYGMARLQTGQRDPAWVQQMQVLQGAQRHFQGVLAATHELWQARAAESARIAQRAPNPTDPSLSARSHAMPAQPIHGNPPSARKSDAASGTPDPQTVLAQVREMTRTGQYPGGVAQMQADVTALVMSGQADAVMVELQAMGAQDVGDKPLVIADHYVDGPEPFEQRWPVQVPLPIPFDQLPREVQFSVLFTEWQRREMEASYALIQGASDSARTGYEECLERARQLGVVELEARSFEGLARVASRLNDRALERQHLKAAVAARAGA